MSIVAALLKAMPGLSRARCAFLSHLFELWPCVQGRHTLLNVSRYSFYCEGTVRRHFALPFDFGAFNLALAQQMFAGEPQPRWMLAYDHSVLGNSGKHTPGVDWFYNGVSGRVERGLEVGLLARVELNSKTAIALHAKQTQNDKSATDKSVTHLRECAAFLPDQGLPQGLPVAVDGAFARRAFVDGACAQGLQVVSRLRHNANLRYLYTGAQNKRGRRKLYQGKVIWKELDTSRWECEGEVEPGVWL